MRKPDGKFRWLQFSLRSLLLLTMLVGAYFGGWVSNESRHRNRPEQKTKSIVITVKSNSSLYRLEQIEKGMKADELEMKGRFRPFQSQDRIRLQP